jgi:hypothetical protein
MPVARFELPDGRVARFEVPEGTTPEQAQALFQQQMPSIMGQTAPAAPTAPAADVPMALRPSVPAAPAMAAPAQPQDQSTWSRVRPFVAPTVEALGAGGGAILGTSLGPAGTVGGAGLGYGIAKEVLEIADVFLGDKKPRKGAAQVVEPVRNIVEGAAFETAGRVAAPFLSKGLGKIADLRNIPQRKASEIARNALGPDLPEVVNALRAAQGQGVSAAQAAADINSPTFQALIQRATERDPRFLLALEKSQGEVSLNALSKLAGGRTAADVRATSEAGKAALNRFTGPTREAALARANLGQDVALFEAQAADLGAEAAAKVQEVRKLYNAGKLAEASARLDLIKQGLPVGLTKYTYKGDLARMADEWASQAANASLDLGQGARFRQAAADSLRSVGIKPLEADPLIRSIRAMGSNPEFAGNDVVLGALRNVADDIGRWANSGGVIDAKALDAIRKNSVNAAIQQLRPGMDATSQRNLAAEVLGRLKPVIVDSIEAAGGTGYRQYLADYTAGMQRIAEQKLTGEALRLWKTDKDSFVRLVQNEAPDVVERFLGPGNYNIATELAEGSMEVLREQAKKRLSELAVKEQASAGQEALKGILMDYLPKWRLPSYLSVVASTTNKGLSILEDKIGKKTMDILTESLKTPEGAANLLESLPAAERNRVLQLLADPNQWGTGVRGAVTGTAAGVTNTLAPERFNQNALNNEPFRVIETE